MESSIQRLNHVSFILQVGYSQLTSLCDHEKVVRGKQCMVLDADDLLSDPGVLLPMVCDKLGIPFDDKMLQWDANNVRVASKLAACPGIVTCFLGG